MPSQRSRSGRKTAAGVQPAKPPAPELRVKPTAVGSVTPARPTHKPPRTRKLVAESTPAAKPSPTEGPGQRFALGPITDKAALNIPAPTEPPESLPASYETGRLLLIARDPQWLCAQWDASADQIERIKSLAKGLAAELRIYSGPARNNLVRRVPIVVPQKRRGTWFVEVPRSDELYSAEIGYQEKPDRWVCMARSAVVRTPPTARSQEAAYEVATIPLEAPIRPLHRPAPEQRAGEPAPQLSPAPAPGFPATVVPLIEEKLTPPIVGGQPSSLAFSPQAPFGAQAGQEAPSSIAVARPAQAERRGFWLNLNVEIVVYGATDPRASFTVSGQPVRLRPDGTFSFRFCFPDGEHELAIEATAPDGSDKRRARLTFHRRTAHEGKVEPAPQSPKLAPPPAPPRKS
ncbi:MAG: DUF4912 domain-containing protein [Verrucomicrobiota bacterium]|nr:DUF4912 domain-containing protein [Verrucomicrobiota bacterium]